MFKNPDRHKKSTQELYENTRWIQYYDIYRQTKKRIQFNFYKNKQVHTRKRLKTDLDASFKVNTICAKFKVRLYYMQELKLF